MRYSIAAILFVAFVAVTRSQHDAHTEIQQFQGSWAAVSIQWEDGRPATMDELAHTRLFINGNRFTFFEKAHSVSGTFTIDPMKTPKTIDVVFDDDPNDKLLGIYEIKGDMRKSCFAISGRERPTTYMHSVPGYLIFEWSRALCISAVK